ncbi:MAG TPA: methyltransferase [Kofleriaceae bacterium]|nr:methyltransferase [Kofleriaceae bacterium]
MVTNVLAWTGVVPAAMTPYFAAFWCGFGWWRRHRAATYAMMFLTVAIIGVAAAVAHERLFAARLVPPWPVQAIGWLLIAFAWILGWIADRQLGLRVRSFAPFFDEHGRIDLVTTGAYRVVRHPIYAAGIAWQLGIALVTGIAAVAAAAAVSIAGAA